MDGTLMAGASRRAHSCIILSPVQGSAPEPGGHNRVDGVGALRRRWYKNAQDEAYP